MLISTNQTPKSDDEFSEALLGVDAVRIDQEEANGVEANPEISDDAITEMFKKTGVLPLAKGGRHQTWSPKFIQLGIELLSNGETAASVYNFFSTQARFYPELLGAGKEVPNVKWFERLRETLPMLNSMQTKDVILKAGRVVLACDGAAMNDCTKSIAVGILNETGKLHLLDIQKSEGGTGEAIASQMLSIIEGTGLGRVLSPKVEYMMSDQESSQRKANLIVAEQLSREDNEERPKSMYCNMHSVSNCCKNSREALREVSPDAICLLDDVKCVFGKPPKSGYVQQDGRRELQLLLQELEGTKSRIFSHDLGKLRFIFSFIYNLIRQALWG